METSSQRLRPLWFAALAGTLWLLLAWWHWTGALYAALAIVLLAAAYYCRPEERWLRLFSLLCLLLPLSPALGLTGQSKWYFPSELIVGVLALALLWRRFDWPFGRWSLLPLALLVLQLPSLLFSQAPLVSLKYLLVQGAYILVFYCGSLLALARGLALAKILALFALGLGPVLLWSLVQWDAYEYNPVTVPGIFRPFFNDHTLWGASLAMLSGFSLLWLGRRPWQILLLLLALGGVLLSTSRAAILSLLPMAAAALYIYFPRIRRLSPLVLVAILVLLWFGRGPISQYLAFNEAGSRSASAGERLESSFNLQSDASNLERFNRWTAAWRMFEARPHSGFGPGTYRFYYLDYQEEAYRNRLTVDHPDYPPEGSGGTAHSEFFLLLSESGWPATALWLLLLLRWSYLGLRYAQPARPELSAGFLALITYLFHMQFNNFLDTDAFAFLFWLAGAAIEWGKSQIKP